MTEVAEQLYPPPLKQWTILFAVILATTLYSTTMMIVTTILPRMQGTFSATADEIAWAMTFNILATAVVTPLTGWLAARFGTRNTVFWCVAGFTLSTLMCGLADSLEALIFWRILQGGFGAPTTPLGQSILMESFPRTQHTRVMGLFGVGVVIGPVLGPWLGSLMAEHYTWRWAFYAIVPLGVLATVVLRFVLPADSGRPRTQLDWIGFLALSISLGAMQLVLARGQRLDWYQSPEIIAETVVAVLAFWIFAVHCLTTCRPFLDPRQLANRNYSIGLLLVTIFGMLNLTPMVLLPPLLTGPAGFSDSLVGTVVAGRGVGGCLGFLIAGFTGRVDARLSMMIGFGSLLMAGIWLTHIDLNVGYLTLALNAGLQGLAIGLIWVPLTTVAFSTVKREAMAEANAIYHLLRNLGSSFFISISVAEIVRSTSANYSRLIENLSQYNKVLGIPSVLGSWNAETGPGLAGLSREVARQATLIAYLNAFGMFTVACAIAIPLILLVRSRSAPST